MEQEVHRIWMLVLELSDQITQNNRVAAELRSQITTLQVSNYTIWSMGCLLTCSTYLGFRSKPRRLLKIQL